MVVGGLVTVGDAEAAADRGAESRTWYVKAGADPAGTGSRGSPLGSLAAVERRSAPGEKIVVLPSGPRAGSLDGGIALKPRQRLIGAGKSVVARRKSLRAPRLTNTDPERLSGDAVVLADGVRVRNLRISESARGGIYGLDVSRARIAGNDISAHNRSCAEGFHIPPFVVPTTVPGVGVPISEGLINGWAGIMLDATRGEAEITIRRNRVHDAGCGDGIDVRAMGTSRVRAEIEGNVVRGLRQGSDFESVLAIGLQSSETARLAARVVDNRQVDLGNPGDPGIGPLGADSEGVFVNPTGPSRMRVALTRNTYRNPRALGGFSANGLEYVSMGDGSRSSLVVRDSSFERTPGDVLEQFALGTNARMRMMLTRVVARDSTGFAESGFGNTVLIPANNGDCLASASAGAGNVVETTITDSALTGCANNGILLGSAGGNGVGPTESLTLDVTGSTITGNLGANLRVGNLEGLNRLAVRIEDSDLSNSRGLTGTGLANLDFENLGRIGSNMVDLGGGALGSRGGNCLEGGNLALEMVGGFGIKARENWWGDPGGPGPGRTLIAGGSLDSAQPLSAPASSCGR